MARKDGISGKDDWEDYKAELRQQMQRREYDQLEEYQRRIGYERDKRRAAEQAQQEKARQDKEHIRPGVGKFIIPGDNTLAGHLRLVKDPSNHLEFSATRYEYFDGMADKAFYSGDIDNSPKYAALRNNIAAVRNYVYARLFTDGSFDGDDAGKAHFLAEMGREIGAALQRDSVFALPLTDSLSRQKANVEGKGAAEIYKLLYKIQERRVSLKKPWLLLGFGKNRNWGLPPIEECPFCEADVTDFVRAQTAPALSPQPEMAPQQETPPPPPEPSFARDLGNGTVETLSAGDIGRQLAALADYIEPPRQFRRVSEMEKPALEESVELARKILENMRIQIGGQMAMDMLQQEPFALKDHAGTLARVGGTYTDSLALGLESHPELANNPAILSANEALGQLSYVMRLAAMRYLTDDTATASQLALQINAMPDSWKQVGGVSMASLLERVELGLQQTQLALTEAEKSNIGLYERSLQTQTPLPGQTQELQAPYGEQTSAPPASFLAENRGNAADAAPSQTSNPQRSAEPEPARGTISPEQKAAIAASSGGANFGMPGANAKPLKANTADATNTTTLRDQQQIALQLAQQREQQRQRQTGKTGARSDGAKMGKAAQLTAKPLKSSSSGGLLDGVLSQKDLDFLRSGSKVGFDAVKPTKIDEDILASSIGPRNKER